MSLFGSGEWRNIKAISNNITGIRERLHVHDVLVWMLQGGMWVLTLMDWYSGSYNLMFVALAELICIMYVYGELTAAPRAFIRLLWLSLRSLPNNPCCS